MKNKLRRVIKQVKLKTWVALIIIVILLPVAIFRVIYNAIGATPVSSATWRMDEAQGATVNDGSNNSNSGTITNAVWRTKELCLSENCLFFDGTGDFVSRADDADFDYAAADSFTFSLWFRHAPKTSGTDVLVVKHNATAGGYKIVMESDGDITCGFDDDSTYGPEDFVTSTAATYDDNQWHHMACVKNGTTSLTLYIDGQSVGTPDTSFAATGTLANANTFYLGIDGNGSSNPYTGFLDEFRMYREALDANEVKVDYNLGASARFDQDENDFLSQGLVGYWKLEEAGDATRVDSSGNGNDLVESTSDTMAQATGKFGKAADFERGDTEIMSDSTFAGISDNSNVTISAWVNTESAPSCSSCRMFVAGIDTFGIVLTEAGTDDNLSGLAVGYWDGGQYTSTGTTAEVITNGTWYHLAVSYDSNAGTYATYINGVLQTSGSLTFSLTTTSFSLGENFNDYYDGLIDEARIYNRVLSPSEVNSLYNWAPGPVGHWKFDDNTGTTTVDSSGNGFTSSTFTGNATWAAGKYGSGLTFDGTNDVVRVPEGTATDLGATTDSFTVSLWMKTTLNLTDVFPVLITKQGPGTTYPFYILLDNSELPTFALEDAAENIAGVTGPTAVNDGNWHHLAGTRDAAADTVSLYVDGVFAGSTTDVTVGSLANNDNIAFGNGGGASYIDQDYTGLIDDVRIYNYVRTAGQIVEDMNGDHPLGGSPIGSQAIYWKFDEGYGTTAFNTVDANADGTLTSIASPATASSGWTATESGKINKAIVFDGSDDKVVIAAASDAQVDFTGSEKFSLSAWIYSSSVPTSTTDEDLIIGKWDQTSSLRAYRLVLENDDTDSTGHIRAEVFDESADGMVGAVTPNDTIIQDTWYHVTMTFNGCTASCPAGTVKVYIDAKDQSTADTSGTFSGLENLASDFTVGDYDATDSVATLDGFTGRIDEVQVFADELSADQVKVVMNAGSATSYGVLGAGESSQGIDGAGDGPIIWWTFDDNTGTATVIDSSGNNFAGTMNGTMTASDWAPGKVGAAIDLDGSNDSISRADNNTLDLASYSVGGWYNWNALGGVEGDWLVTKGDGNDVNYYIVWNEEGNGQIYCASYDFGTDSGLGPGYYTITPTLGQWYHFMCTFDNATDIARFYVNGVNVLTSTGQTLDPTTTQNTGTLYVGRNTGSDFANFKVDDFKLYNYARTPAQVAYDYNRGGPVGWWKFDECTGTVANDSSGKGLVGTITPQALDNTSAGTCNSGTATHMWNDGSIGKFNSGLGFDGDDDYVDITHNAALATTNSDVTMSVWFNRSGSTTTGHQLLCKINGAGCSYGMDMLDSDNQWRVNIRNLAGTATSYDSGIIVGTGSWEHLAATVTDNGTTTTIRFYHNGRLVRTTAGGIRMNDVGSNLRIGTVGSSRYANGIIDDVRIYNYTLTLTQIQKVYNEGSGARFGPLTGSP